jgi:hypothetical protein
MIYNRFPDSRFRFLSDWEIFRKLYFLPKFGYNGNRNIRKVEVGIMRRKRWLAALALCAMLFLTILSFVDQAWAQNDSTSNLDKNMATKHGVSDSLASTEDKGDGKPTGASIPQMMIGVGSIFVMIAVVKWL